MVNFITYLKKLWGKKPSDKILGVLPDLYYISVGESSSAYYNYDFMYEKFSHVNKMRIMKTLTERTYGIIIESTNNYYLFQTLDGYQTIIESYAVRKVSDEDVLKIYQEGSMCDITMDDICDIFIDFEDNNATVIVSKTRYESETWDISIRFSTTNSWSDMKKFEKHFSTLNKCLDRLVSRGYSPTTDLGTFPRIQIKINKINI
jgi:hypothetical protein